VVEPGTRSGDATASPLVSYVVITRDRQRELLRCLQSLEEQDYPAKEVVVVDNGSAGGAQEVLHSFPRVRLIELPSNRGVPEARNEGARAAAGEVCVFIDDDAEFADRSATRRLLRYFDRDPRLGVLAFVIRDPTTGREEHASIPRADKRSVPGDYPCCYFCGCGFALRRQLFFDLGMFWGGLFYGGEELDFSYRVLDRDYRLLRCGAVEVIHRRVTHGRPKGQYLYFNARNRLWIAVKNLPIPYAFSTALVWWPFLAALGLARGQLGFVVGGIRDALWGLPALWKHRGSIGRRATRQLRLLSGRLWY
jgi:GT2 family glycosyltransferase